MLVSHDEQTMAFCRQTANRVRRTVRAMPAPLSHFAVNADDVDRARRFYRAVLGWTFSPWGPPGFFHIDTGSADGPMAALQQRRDLLDGERTVGFECTFAVDDVPATIKAALANGGEVLMAPTVITGVGELAFLRDSEGNALGVMRYDGTAE